MMSPSCSCRVNNMIQLPGHEGRMRAVDQDGHQWEAHHSADHHHQPEAPLSAAEAEMEWQRQLAQQDDAHADAGWYAQHGSNVLRWPIECVLNA